MCIEWVGILNPDLELSLNSSTPESSGFFPGQRWASP